MAELVTVGVPIYRGEAFLAETLRSIQASTYRDLDVLISVDGPDAACEKICSGFLADSRFRMVVQPERLGWVGNTNWLMSQMSGEFWYYHQQDDLTDPSYVSTLVVHARDHPEAALVHCDLVPFGRIEGRFSPALSVLGATAYGRQMVLLHEHLPAFAFRGLARAAAVRRAGGLITNDCNNYGVDTAWLAAIALSGELHRVPLELYRKRYHDHNTESRWWAWLREQRLEAWSCHCVNMVEQALRVEATTWELRLLWLAAVERLSSPGTSTPFFQDGPFSQVERATLFDAFMRRARGSAAHDIPRLLAFDWEELGSWSARFHRVAGA